MNSRIFVALALLLAASSTPACDCNGETDDDLLDAGLDDAADGSMPPIADSGPGSICAAAGAACDDTVSCCSGVCSNGLCDTPKFCAAPGASCSVSTECCTLHCLGGACVDQLCLATGQACSSPAHCCSNLCGASGSCEAVPPGPGGDTCKTLGETCGADGDCCSTNCQGGVCVRAYSCQANGDVCFTHGDCCGNFCSSDGVSPGRCQVVTGGGASGCVQGGNPCASGGAPCCSRVCVDLGSGASVCQVTGGCRLTGEWCSADDDCCGGGINPNGTVECGDGPGGRCDNGEACNAVGNICGAPVLPGGGKIPASQDCCNGKKEVCKLDVSGVPRCFGGCDDQDVCPADCPTGYDWADPDCCIATGDICQFSDQCCNRAPCLPGSDGIYRCADAPLCLPLGSACTPGSDPACCLGTTCRATGIGDSFACQAGTPDPGGPRPDGGPSDGAITDAAPAADGGSSDGSSGSTDAGACSPNLATCSTGSECCSGLCLGGVCTAPRICEPENASCTGSSDCCEGLSCVPDPGATTGTCRPGAVCNTLGQACTRSQTCCSGLLCQSEAGGACDGTSHCICFVNL